VEGALEEDGGLLGESDGVNGLGLAEIDGA